MYIIIEEVQKDSHVHFDVYTAEHNRYGAGLAGRLCFRREEYDPFIVALIPFKEEEIISPQTNMVKYVFNIPKK